MIDFESAFRAAREDLRRRADSGELAWRAQIDLKAAPRDGEKAAEEARRATRAGVLGWLTARVRGQRAAPDAAKLDGVMS